MCQFFIWKPCHVTCPQGASTTDQAWARLKTLLSAVSERERTPRVFVVSNEEMAWEIGKAEGGSSINGICTEGQGVGRNEDLIHF